MAVFLRIITTILITTILLASCRDRSTKVVSSAKSLHYQITQLGDSKLKMKIPDDYKMNENLGPDFVVYYFSPLDTITDNIGNGGIYFGRYPSLYGRDNPDKKIDSFNSKLLTKDSRWTVFKTTNGYYAETIQASDNEKTHAFVTSKSRSNLDTLVHIFSTLTEK